ncbi:hypothetical protein CesoFtcFv8_013201 [Champsocephalus esox]|uniref:Uncharacterized protein n=1 Tax=Champsocephalus esox TaxID=159716 RepID=A0AAN8GVG4_9TELE|nr:hypothetical protein CesoFtcFv8_013201 [Champsocephalus esox]
MREQKEEMRLVEEARLIRLEEEKKLAEEKFRQERERQLLEELKRRKRTGRARGPEGQKEGRRIASGGAGKNPGGE